MLRSKIIFGITILVCVAIQDVNSDNGHGHGKGSQNGHGNGKGNHNGHSHGKGNHNGHGHGKDKGRGKNGPIVVTVPSQPDGFAALAAHMKAYVDTFKAYYHSADDRMKTHQERVKAFIERYRNPANQCVETVLANFLRTSDMNVAYSYVCEANYLPPMTAAIETARAAIGAILTAYHGHVQCLADVAGCAVQLQASVTAMVQTPKQLTAAIVAGLNTLSSGFLKMANCIPLAIGSEVVKSLGYYDDLYNCLCKKN